MSVYGVHGARNLSFTDMVKWDPRQVAGFSLMSTETISFWSN